MLKFLSVKNWSRYSREFSEDQEALYKYKRIILFSQFALFGSVAGFLHSLEDLVDGLGFMPLMDMTMAVGIFICYVLNERGKHLVAKVLLLSFLNIFFFVYSSLVPPELGIYLYYFPWVGLAAVVFEINENRLRIFFISLSVVLLLILFISHFNVFGTFKFEAIDLERSFVINLVSSIVVLTFFIVFMSNMNQHSESQLYTKAEEVKEKNKDLEKVNGELDRFFYSVSHDLKVPVMDIKGILNEATSETRDEIVMNYFLLLKDRANKLDDFLKDIIDYARNAKASAVVSSVNISQLVDEVIENFRFIPGADKVQIEKSIQLDHEMIIDRVRLYIILNNIIANAVYYQRSNVKSKWVKVVAELKHTTLVITVSDNGQGIEKELIPKIFNMFFRGTNQSKGSGLGLYIVKEAVERMLGSIFLESEVGKGTSFTLTFPVSIGEKIKEGSKQKLQDKISIL